MNRNLFDFFIVLVSWLAYPLQYVPGLASVRIVRVLRTVRVFKRVASMRLMLAGQFFCPSAVPGALCHLSYPNLRADSLCWMLAAISSAMVPMMNAFFLMFLVTAVYAVLAVDLFGEKFPLYFGSFSPSFFTMFQMLTGDEWSTVTREMFDVLNGGEINRGVAFFFCSYIVGCGIILINIVVAVLLDEFIKAVEAEKVHKRELDLKDRPSNDEKGSLDPLLRFIVNLYTFEEQEQQVDIIFDLLCAQAEELERSCEHESGRHGVDP